jgi:hypothetical protein
MSDFLKPTRPQLNKDINHVLITVTISDIAHSAIELHKPGE